MAACCALCTHGVLILLNDSLSALLSVVGGLRSVVVYMSAELHEPQVSGGRGVKFDREHNLA